MSLFVRLLSLTLTLLFLALRTEAQITSSTTTSPCLRVIYRLSYKSDSAVATPKIEQMILRVSGGASCFKSMYMHVHDSVFASLSNKPAQERANEANTAALKEDKGKDKSESYYSIFKEAAKNNVFYHDKIRTIEHQYQEQAPLFHWKMMPTIKVIAGYKCQQAFSVFGGRTWEAWFTRDIPVSEGPYKFYGLPGLIIKVRDTHDNYVFELLSLESHPKSFVITATSPVPLITKTKFKQAKRNDELTFLDQMASWGNQIPESMRNNYLAKLKRRNNPLELK